MNKEKIVLVSQKDIRVEWFSGHGGGGQYRNKHANCCRITHPESGAVGQGTKQRSQTQNRADAFKAMTNSPKFKVWLNRKLYELQSSKTLEQRVEDQMKTSNLKVEGIDENGQWVTIE